MKKRQGLKMSVKEQNARNYFSDGYNCAQSVLGAFCEENDMAVKTAFKIANGFGGGMRCGEVCGAVSGAVLVIGLKCGFHVEEDVEQKLFCNQKTFEFIEKFKKENGSPVCRDLLGADIRSPDDFNKPELQNLFKTVCPEMIASAVRILENMDYERK